MKRRAKLSNRRAHKRRKSHYSPWSDLPANILHLILNLLCFPDRIRVASVCAYWRSAAAEFHLLTLPSDCPWVIGAQSPDSDDRIFFFSIEEKRYYELNIRVDKRSVCCGSSEGWIMMGHPLTRKFLVNPISGEKFRLPPQNIHPIKKVIVSSSPTSSSSARVLVLHADENRISSCYPGDKSWTVVDVEKAKFDRYSYCDIIMGEDEKGLCLVCKELDNSVVELKCFLLKFKGEVFMSLVTFRKEPRLMLNFYIYKEIDRDCWIHCKNLGDRTMFLSAECSKIVVANEGSIFRRNSVYYIDSSMRKLFAGCLEEGSALQDFGDFYPGYLHEDFGDFYPRMWFFPNT